MRPVLSHPLRLAELPQRKPTAIRLVPDAGELETLADRLGVDAFRKVRFEAVLAPDGGRDWLLKGHLGATVVQPCRVTTDPVTTRIEEDVVRRYTPDMAEVTEEEIEMTEDENVEPLPAVLDAGDLLEEVLALAVPDFPRAEGAEDIDLTAAPPGAEPLTEESVKPFAGLAALRDKLGGPKDE
ncbi:YceD family protein [Jannaschia sp. KMU-145]|uniref:YceD family protein n=1 Tax=Jannaschia halovivens TaxID=3388667 RepID=UPI00396B3997